MYSVTTASPVETPTLLSFSRSIGPAQPSGLLGQLPPYSAVQSIPLLIPGNTSTSWSTGAIAHPGATSLWPPTQIPGGVMPSGNGMIQTGQPPGPSSLGMILSPSMEPIPPKLVQRITDGQIVEMRDLLQDNVALQQQVDAIAGPFQLPPISGLTRPRLREAGLL